MFLLRSAFWLTLAFLVMGPRDIDLAASANALSSQAISAGEKIIVGQIGQNACTTLTCAGSQALIAAAIASSTPSVVSPMQDLPTQSPVPFPRPRPETTG